jgi:chorismate-pyruvate lyase
MMSCPAQPLPALMTAALASASSGSQRPETPPGWAALLARFYARAGLELAPVRRLRGAEVPEPYRRLLVHSRDMTPTLEAYHGRKLIITVLSREREEEFYLREVLLRPAPEAAPVEYGVIRISLGHLPAGAQAAVLAEERPFGDILQAEAIGHLSWPQAFFAIAADGHLGRVLGARRPARLYGRRNVLVDGARRLLAEAIEVLPPAEQE